MRSKKPLIISLIVAGAVLLAAGITVLIVMLNRKEPDVPPDPPSKDPEIVYIFKDNSSSYSIAWSNDGVAHQDYANKIFQELAVNHGFTTMQRYEHTASSSDNEILIGLTSRPLSAELKAAVDAANASGQDFVWGYAYKDGKLAFYANSEKAFDYGWSKFWSTVIHSDGIYCLDNLWEIGIKTYADYQEDLRLEQIEAEKEAIAERNKKLQSLRAAISKFNGMNVGDPLKTFSKPYGSLSLVPDTSHPRIWVNSETLPAVIEKATAPENEKLYNKVKKIADDAVSSGGTGSLGNEAPNYSTSAISVIESLAYMYLITDDDIYGYTAILYAFNFLNTVKFDPDPAQEYNNNNKAGASMYIMAEVYDWCYDLFLPKQRENFITATCNKLGALMEVGYPPESLGAIVGHGTGAQVLRNWVSFAIAVYDPDITEYANIYHNVLGRVLNQYMEAPNWYYQSGTNHSGSSYSCDKIYCNTVSDMLMYYATGEHIYEVEFEDALMSLINRQRPDGSSIRIGDDYLSSSKSYSTGKTSSCAFLAASYYENATAKAWYKYWSNNYDAKWEGILEVTPVFFLIHNNPEVTSTTEDRFALDLISYTEAPLSTLVVRSAWSDESAWLTYTGMEEAYAANHDHKDAGTFQIFYKGILAPDTTAYQLGDQAYGSLLDLAYTKQTISKNGLLIYNPKYEAQGPNISKDTMQWKTIWDGETYAWVCGNFYYDVESDSWLYNSSTINTGGKWLYSGGQTTQGAANGEPTTLAGWIASGRTNQSTLLGKSSKIENGETVYAYIAGDITNAYDADTVNSVTRATMTVATGDAEHPMVFLVYDRITSDDASYKKTFVLHTTDKPTFGAGASVTDPVIPDNSGVSSTTKPEIGDPYTYVSGTNTFYYTNKNGPNGELSSFDTYDYDGRLTTTTLLPKQDNLEYSYVGGDGYRFWIDGVNAGAEDAVGTNCKEVGWGRVEISPVESSLTDSFLNVMYVSDADNSEYVPATLVECSTHEGAVTFGNVIMFSKSAEPVFETVSFTADGTGDMTYYVTGLEEGRWEVKVNDETQEVLDVIKSEGMLSFEAPAGASIEIVPKFQRMTLILNGGEMSEYIPAAYYPDSDFPVPETVEKFAHEFRGWYYEPDFSGERVTVIPKLDDPSQAQPITLYAKWEKVFGVVTYYTNGGEYAEGYTAPIANRLGTELVLPTAQDISKEQCEFVGWYTDPLFTGEKILTIPAEDAEDYTLYAKFDGPVYYSSTRQNVTSIYPFGYGDTFGDMLSVPGDDYGKFTFHLDTADNNNSGWDLTSTSSNSGFRLFNSLTSVSQGNSVTVYFINFVNGKMVTYGGLELMEMNSGEVVDVVVDIVNKSFTYYVGGIYVTTEYPTQADAFATDFNYYNSPMSDYDEEVYKQNSNIQGPIQLIGQSTRKLSWDELKIYIGDAHDETEAPEGAQRLVLNTNGGSISGKIPFAYFSDAECVLPTEVTRYGYTFLGWYGNAELEGEPVLSIPAGESGDKTFYAKWEKAFGIVSYMLNGGKADSTWSIDKYENHEGASLTLPTDVSKPFSTFLGWYTTPNYAEGTKIEALPEAGIADFRLYAKFDGPVLAVEEGSTTGGYIKRDNAEILNFRLGTELIAAGEDILTVRIDTATSGNINWGEEGSLINGFRLFTPLKAVEGGVNYNQYLFNLKDGYMVTPDGVKLISKNSGDVLDMVLNLKEKTIKYYVNGNYIAEYTGCKFASDYMLYNCYDVSDLDFDATLYTQFSNYRAPLQIPGGTTRAIAWDSLCIYTGTKISDSPENYYSLKAELDGGTAQGIPAGYYSTEGYTLPTPDSGTVTKYGYTFLGWVDGENNPITEIAVGTTGEITVYAKWQKAFGFVSYELNGAVADSEWDESVYQNREGVALTLPTDISKPMCQFLGWYTTSNYAEGTKLESLPENGIDDFKLYAKFDGPVYYSENPELNGGYPFKDIALGDLIEADGSGKFTIRIDVGAASSGWQTVSSDGTMVSSPAQGTGFRVLAPLQKDGDTSSGSSLWIIRFVGGKMYTYKGQALISEGDDSTVDIVVDIENHALIYYIDGVLVYTEVLAEGQWYMLPYDDYNRYNCYGSYDEVGDYDYKTIDGVTYERKSWGVVQFVSDSNGTARVIDWDLYAIFVGENISDIPEGYGELKLIPNGGTYATSVPVIYKLSEGFTLPEVSRAGYAFLGWFDNIDCEGDPVTAILPNAEVKTYYAGWEKIAGAIVYNLNGGAWIGSFTGPTENFKDSVIELPTIANISKTGATWVKWYTTENFAEGTEIASIPAGDNNDYTLYALYDAVYSSDSPVFVNGGYPFAEMNFGNMVESQGGKLTLKFDISATGNSDWESYLSDGTVNPNATNATGIRFIPALYPQGTTNAGTELYIIRLSGGKMYTFYGEELITMGDDSVIDIVIDIEAKVITYYVDGVLKHTDALIDAHKYMLPSDDYNRYNCYAQYETIDGKLCKVIDGVTYERKAGGIVQFVSTSNGHTRVINWDNYSIYLGENVSDIPEGYNKLNLVTNGGEFTESVPVIYDSTQSFTLPTAIEREGHSFDGWYTTSDFQAGTELEVIAAGAAEATYYAKWTRLWGVITYVTNDGTINSEYSTKNENGTAITLPTDVTKEQSEFRGWYTTPSFDEGTEITSIPAESTEDITVYARFVGPIYYKEDFSSTVTYLAEGTYFGDIVERDGDGVFTLHLDTAATGNVSWEVNTSYMSGIRMFNPLSDVGAASTKQSLLIILDDGWMKSFSGTELIEINSGKVVDVVVDLKNKTFTYYVDGVYITTDYPTAISEDLAHYNCPSLGYDSEAYVETSNYKSPLQLMVDGDRKLACDVLAIYAGEKITPAATGE